ncbi:MAG: arylesterase [Burkholderiales bacterium]|nr:arylesterase [Burkholderiales bacterium]
MHNFPTGPLRAQRRDFILLAALATLGAGAATAPARTTVLVLGDSMSAEYGLPRGSGWVALLRQRLAEERIDAEVVNASVSGDTTAGGRSRLPALLQAHRPAVVVIELGGNDALRGLPLQNTQANLAWMVQQAQQSGARVLLVGMQVPPNYGADYARRFAAGFEAVAREHRSALVPFLLAGIADGPDPLALFQPDRIHPNAQAQPRMLDNVWPALKPLLHTQDSSKR